ncbi:FadR/GntR family transcriptional regulator [Microbacterium sp. MAHUQ-60]|uniref:FadR/GntR family transcriptional regulator n=1 Tax=unclassified Microbacterium TaxID=2609290 RepID=UPI0036074D29
MTIVNRRPQKVAMLVAQQIMSDVSRDKLEPGDRLPPERVMLEEYEIGRGTLREALRLLEFQGAIALRSGPGGGPVLLDPTAAHLGSSLLLLMQMKGAPYRSVVEVRQGIEPFTSRLAATNISDSALETLAGTISRMREASSDSDDFFEANKEFHDLIGWSSGNALLGYFNESLMGIMDGTAIGIEYQAHSRQAIIAAHEQIYEALQAHDPDAAEAHMRAHIDAYAVLAQKRFPEVLDRKILWEHAN